ncbi:MAG: HAMP domain-containing histidine kinase [Phycisphaerae bacterium]|nr:HAMP domain-containing histidine kinase [Phycisphaerae bacterium]
MIGAGGGEDIELLRRMLARERAAREQAEMLLESKSRDLHSTLSSLQGVVRELDAARRQAEHHSAAKGLFLADLSHELRTPLNAVIGYAEMIAEDSRGEQVVEDARRIVVAGRGLLGLINNVLDYSKAESGKLELSLQTVEVPAVIEESIAIVVPMVMETGSRLKAQVEPGFGMVTSDPVRLRQVLLNLLSNSAKHTKQGSITVKAAHLGPDEYRIEVSDTGRGMDRGQLDRLFEPFQPVRREDGMRFASTGLGMSITRRIVLMLGGRIAVQSTVGQGTTVTVDLPVAGPGDQGVA